MDHHFGFNPIKIKKIMKHFKFDFTIAESDFLCFLDIQFQIDVSKILYSSVECSERFLSQQLA